MGTKIELENQVSELVRRILLRERNRSRFASYKLSLINSLGIAPTDVLLLCFHSAIIELKHSHGFAEIERQNFTRETRVLEEDVEVSTPLTALTSSAIILRNAK